MRIDKWVIISFWLIKDGIYHITKLVVTEVIGILQDYCVHACVYMQAVYIQKKNPELSIKFITGCLRSERELSRGEIELFPEEKKNGS